MNNIWIKLINLEQIGKYYNEIHIFAIFSIIFV